MSFFCFRRWQKWILMGIMRRIILNKYFVVLWTCFQMMIRNFPRQDTSLTLVPPSPSLGHITTAYADYWVLAFIISLITLQISRSSYWFYLRSLFGEERVETKLNFHLPSLCWKSFAVFVVQNSSILFLSDNIGLYFQFKHFNFGFPFVLWSWLFQGSHHLPVLYTPWNSRGSTCPWILPKLVWWLSLLFLNTTAFWPTV